MSLNKRWRKYVNYFKQNFLRYNLSKSFSRLFEETVGCCYEDEKKSSGDRGREEARVWPRYYGPVNQEFASCSTFTLLGDSAAFLFSSAVVWTTSISRN